MARIFVVGRLPLRPSSASGAKGHGANAPLIGSFSADPLDMRLRRGAAEEAALRSQPTQHGLSWDRESSATVCHHADDTDRCCRQTRSSSRTRSASGTPAWCVPVCLRFLLSALVSGPRVESMLRRPRAGRRSQRGRRSRRGASRGSRPCYTRGRWTRSLTRTRPLWACTHQHETSMLL